MITIRPASRADIVEFYGEMLNESMRARVADLNGKVVGIIGLVYKDYPTLVSTLTPELRPYRKTILKEAKRFLSEIHQTAYAVACPKEKTSQRLLEHLGFEFIRDTTEGRLYRWQTQ